MTVLVYGCIKFLSKMRLDDVLEAVPTDSEVGAIGVHLAVFEVLSLDESVTINTYSPFNEIKVYI
jgi:hypothetical protein